VAGRDVEAVDGVGVADARSATGGDEGAKHECLLFAGCVVLEDKFELCADARFSIVPGSFLK